MADHVSFTLIGGEKFMVDLHAWHSRLRSDVEIVARECASYMLADQTRDMPRKSGQLLAGMKYGPDPKANALAVRYKVASEAYVAHILDRGTKERYTRQGWRRGRILPRGTWIPTAIKWRTIFVRTVMDVMRRPVPAIGPGNPDVEER